MTITVFDIKPSENQRLKMLNHQKPTFTDIAIKISHIRMKILRLRDNLGAIDKMLDDMHDCIIDLEEITKHD